MACRLVGAKPLCKPRWNIVHWIPRNKLKWNHNRNSYIFTQENALESAVCKMVATSFRPQCVKVSIKPFSFVNNNNQLGVIFFQLKLVKDAEWLSGNRFTYLPLDKMATNSQMIYSDAFSWMTTFVFWLQFHQSLFLRVQLTISQHWFK